MKKEHVVLQPSERVLMEQLWEEEPLTVTTLFHRLNEKCSWSKSTVNTMLKRMVEKNLIRFEQGEKAKLYYSNVKRGQADFAETDNLLQRIFNGSVSMMMSTLLNEKKLSNEEIEELHKLLDKMED